MNKTQNFLLSFPKSGNTWVRYCIEFLSKKPTDAIDFVKKERKQTIGLIYKDLGINLNDDLILIKIHHFPDALLNKSFRKDRLLFLVRNPIEVLTREGNYSNSLEIRLEKYINLIRTYEKWKSDKLLFYYEDLILTPAVILKKILDFLNIEDKLLNNFMENYNSHKDKSINYYNKYVEHSFTQGNKLNYHYSKANKKDLIFIQKCLKSKYKNLYQEYLYRY